METGMKFYTESETEAKKRRMTERKEERCPVNW